MSTRFAPGLPVLPLVVVPNRIRAAQALRKSSATLCVFASFHPSAPLTSSKALRLNLPDIVTRTRVMAARSSCGFVFPAASRPVKDPLLLRTNDWDDSLTASAVMLVAPHYDLADTPNPALKPRIQIWALTVAELPRLRAWLSTRWQDKSNCGASQFTCRMFRRPSLNRPIPLGQNIIHRSHPSDTMIKEACRLAGSQGG